MSSIRDQIQKMVKGMIRSTIIVGQIVSVDENNWTVTVKLNNNDLEIDEVRLTSIIESSPTSGLFIKPSLNSYVLIGIIDNRPESMFIAKYSSIDAVKFITDSMELCGDSFGGLIKIDDLKTQWDANVAAIKTAVSAGFAALTSLDGGASNTAFQSSSGGIKNLVKSSLENEKVKHG